MTEPKKTDPESEPEPENYYYTGDIVLPPPWELIKCSRCKKTIMLIK